MSTLSKTHITHLINVNCNSWTHLLMFTEFFAQTIKNSSLFVQEGDLFAVEGNLCLISSIFWQFHFAV